MTITGFMWECMKCGYIRYGDKPPKECPECGALKDEFIKLPEEIVAEREKTEWEKQR